MIESIRGDETQLIRLCKCVEVRIEIWVKNIDFLCLAYL